MERLHYGRIVSAGWILLFVVATSLWARDDPQWHRIVGVLLSDKATSTLAVIAALAGFGGPLAVGVVLDRLSALLLAGIGRQMWTLGFNRTFADLLSGAGTTAFRPELAQLPAAGAFHAFFYSYADSRLIDWMRRRTTQVYASLTSTMAIAIALVLTQAVFHSFSFPVAAVCLVLMALLLTYARYVTRAIEETGTAWVLTLGRKLAEDFRSGREPADALRARDSRRGESPAAEGEGSLVAEALLAPPSFDGESG
jgi:hypothetical protein